MTWPTPSLEELITQDFGLRDPTPLQRGICRIADGRKLGELYGHPDIETAIGPLDGMERGIPKAMLLLCAIRGGKSMIASAAGVRCGLTADTTPCGPGDVPRVSVLSTRKDEAKVILDHLLGAFRTSDRLRSLLVKEPTADGLTFRHPTGRPIEIRVVAGSRAGVSLSARFLVAAIFDEAAKMVGSEEGVINLDDARHNVAGRLMESGCSPEWMISSPWAPFGPVYEEVVTRWRKPSSSMVVVRARGDLMNPKWWTPTRAAELEKNNPDAYRTDYLAEFADPDTALVAGVHIERAIRKEPLQIVPGEGDRYEYAAEMDPATRSNAWTLVVTRREGRRTVVCLAKEWKGSKVRPLSSRQVLAEIAELLTPYRIAHSEAGRKRIGTDQYAVDQIREIAKEVRLDVVEFPATRASNDDGYTELARRFELGEMEIPNIPNLVSDVRRLRRVVTAGSIHVNLPQTSDGRHCDFGPPLMRASQRMTYQPAPPDNVPQWKKEQDASLQRAINQYGRKRDVPWWKRSA